VLEQISFATAMALVAAAYAAVGQGGATGYIALTGLAGFDAEVIRTTALTLNLLVSTLGVVLFAKAGLLKPRNVYFFAVLGVPCSVLGGATHLSPIVYHPVVGALLLIAAWQMARSARRSTTSAKENTPPVLPSLMAGATIGFVAGVTGIGGGILLAPLMLMLSWADACHLLRPRQSHRPNPSVSPENNTASGGKGGRQSPMWGRRFEAELTRPLSAVSWA
jgi:uncharacterized protein